MKTYWISGVPQRCELCDDPIEGKFYDAATKTGQWACMCPGCHRGDSGWGLGRVGPGFGQEYTKQPDGRWLKTAG